MCCHPHCHSEGSLQGAGRKGVTLAPEELSALYVGGHSWGSQITLRTPEALELRAVCGERHAHPGTRPLLGARHSQCPVGPEIPERA